MFFCVLRPGVTLTGLCECSVYKMSDIKIRAKQIKLLNKSFVFQKKIFWITDYGTQKQLLLFSFSSFSARSLRLKLLPMSGHRQMLLSLQHQLGSQLFKCNVASQLNCSCCSYVDTSDTLSCETYGNPSMIWSLQTTFAVIANKKIELQLSQQLTSYLASLEPTASNKIKKTMWQSVGLTVLVIVATLVCAVLFMLFGKFEE